MINIPVPFVQVGNRRALTEQSVAECVELRAFVERFRDSFDYDAIRGMWILKETDDSQD